MNQLIELKVFIENIDEKCDQCGEKLGRKAWITLKKDKGALSLVCADLDHLIFLPSGNTALTRRARQNSILSAVVLKWSQSRRRYERQGVLIEENALRNAEKECLADDEIRSRRREREAERRAEIDIQYIDRFAKRVRELFPLCPTGREISIAEHACLKYSGRIGRTATAKGFEENAIRLAVIAHIRHAETSYDEHLAKGNDRSESRFRVNEKVTEIMNRWEQQ